MFTAKEVGHEDLLTPPSDRGVLRDLPNLEMGRIGNLFGSLGQSASRWTIGRRGCPLTQRLVRPLMVVDLSERVEAALLGPEVLPGRACRASLQGSVHAFVAAVLMGARRLNQLGPDAQLDPADGESREASDG